MSNHMFLQSMQPVEEKDSVFKFNTVNPRILDEIAYSSKEDKFYLLKYANLNYEEFLGWTRPVYEIIDECQDSFIYVYYDRRRNESHYSVHYPVDAHYVEETTLKKALTDYQDEILLPQYFYEKGYRPFPAL